MRDRLADERQERTRRALGLPAQRDEGGRLVAAVGDGGEEAHPASAQRADADLDRRLQAGQLVRQRPGAGGEEPRGEVVRRQLLQDAGGVLRAGHGARPVHRRGRVVVGDRAAGARDPDRRGLAARPGVGVGVRGGPADDLRRLVQRERRRLRGRGRARGVVEDDADGRGAQRPRVADRGAHGGAPVLVRRVGAEPDEDPPHPVGRVGVGDGADRGPGLAALHEPPERLRRGLRRQPERAVRAEADDHRVRRRVVRPGGSDGGGRRGIGHPREPTTAPDGSARARGGRRRPAAREAAEYTSYPP
ncbi:unannotated protein [freshwater metagenome]|uniref:Unannotated protein n=1 Tax=freshwater metagenome TaxID=449393 RepID=A0A6J7JWC9_9ZZZZ